MQIELLVDSVHFWERLAEDIAGARSRVYVQTLSFEGDAAGTALAAALTAAACPDRRVLVDTFTRFILNDRFIYWPRYLLDSGLRAEARATAELLAGLARSGVDVRFTNPVRGRIGRVAVRDHKKQVVVDGRVAYIGGINFSDHNFDWHDMMLRIEAPDVAALLERDFLATCEGRNVYRAGRFPGIELHLLDGRSNARAFEPVFELLRSARHRIVAISPYIGFPFLDHLRVSRRRGVQVTVISPALNNRGFLRRNLEWESVRSGFDLWLYQGRMSHLKALLVDETHLVAGSSNFDALSYAVHPEIVAIITEPSTIARFRADVVEPDLAESVRFDGRPGRFIGRARDAGLRVAARILGRLSRL